jgi:D-glycerate 3-kinase
VTDNPLLRSSCPTYEGRPQLILIDGWCLGASAQSDTELETAINDIEAKADDRGKWRRAINENLKLPYALAFARFDAIIYLRAPDFDVIHHWRCEQEEGLLGRDLSQADRHRIAIFIQHFERITRHMMSGGRRADIEMQLDAERNVTEVKRI